MQQDHFKIVVEALTQLGIFWGGFLAAWKSWKEYLSTKVAEADRKSQALMIEALNKEIELIKEWQTKSIYSEKELRTLMDRFLEELHFFRDLIFNSRMPRRNIKTENNKNE